MIPGDFALDSSREPDPRLAFESERELTRPAVQRQLVRHRRPALIALASFVALVVAAGVYVWLAARPGAVPTTAPAAVSFTSNPDGAEVTIDGVARGHTPIKLSLSAGEHRLELRHGSRVRTMPILVAAGSVMSQDVELGAEPVPTTGRLEIASDAPGAQVVVDGSIRGVTPLSLPEIAAGEHHVTIVSGDTRVSRTVTVPGGAVATVMASVAAPAGVSAGWLSVSAPFELQVLEDGRLVGTSSTERLMLPAGRHTFDLVSTAFEFKSRQTTDVPVGKTATLTVAVPNGSLSVNALPWADVSLDGRSMGVTPLGNLLVPVGSHEVVWRHPQLGERRRTVAVTAQTPARIAVDFSK